MRSLPLHVLLLPLLLLSAPPAPPARQPGSLLGEAYPIEVSVAFPGALLHWLDSLIDSGPTAGKTQQAHEREYRRVLGEQTPEEVEMLRSFARARLGAAATQHLVTVAFFEERSLDAALARSRPGLGSDAAAFERAVRFFEPRYRVVWDGGRVVREFLDRSRADPNRIALGDFLARVARFYGVSPQSGPPPQLVLAPVPGGSGTHAQAIERFLLIEVRPDEGLMEQTAPIVHENAHRLFQRMSSARLAELEEVVVRAGDSAFAPARLLHEALPTAIAQGVADLEFRRGRWSIDAPWYHRADVDRYAKRLFPLVKRTLDAGGSFDAEFLRAALALYR